VNIDMNINTYISEVCHKCHTVD